MVTIDPPPAASINGSAARAVATSEYALMSTAIQKRSRGVSVNRPSRSSAAANATEWTRMSSFPSNVSATSPKTRSIAASSRTSSSVTSELETVAARSRTFFSIRSPWNVKASWAPPSASRRAIAQAIERLFATPRTSARFPSNIGRRLYLASDTVRNLASPPPRLGGFRTVGGDLRVRRADADPAPHGRGLAAACARGRDHDPGRASPGRHACDHPPFAAAARRLAEQRPPRVRRPLAAARHTQHELPRLPLPARPPPGRRRRPGARGDPAGTHPGAFRDPARRLCRATPCEVAAAAAAARLDRQDLSE